MCVCECFESIECHDALHVGNFLVSCIPIGSSLTMTGAKVGELPDQFDRFRKSLISGNGRIDRAILDHKALHLLGLAFWGRLGKCVCVCVSALSQLKS